jgi:hypothetical protein
MMGVTRSFRDCLTIFELNLYDFRAQCACKLGLEEICGRFRRIEVNIDKFLLVAA